MWFFCIFNLFSIPKSTSNHISHKNNYFIFIKFAKVKWKAVLSGFKSWWKSRLIWLITFFWSLYISFFKKKNLVHRSSLSIHFIYFQSFCKTQIDKNWNNFFWNVKKYVTLVKGVVIIRVGWKTQTNNFFFLHKCSKSSLNLLCLLNIFRKI